MISPESKFVAGIRFVTEIGEEGFEGRGGAWIHHGEENKMGEEEEEGEMGFPLLWGKEMKR